MSDILYGLWQNHERLDEVSRAMIGRGLASLFAVTAALAVTKSLAWAVVALLVVWWSWLLSYEGAVARGIVGGGAGGHSPRWERQSLCALARLAFPLGLVMLLISLNASIPRLLLARSHGEAALGYLAALAYLVIAGTTVMNALGQSAAPRLARLYVGDRAGFSRLLSRMIWLAMLTGACGALLAILGGRWLLALLYRPEYALYAGVLSVLAVAGSLDLLSGTLGFAFTATRRFGEYVIPFAGNTLAGAVVGFLLIPAMGLEGAAFTVLAISSGQLLAVSLLLRNALGRERGSGGPAALSVEG
jgi:O-antigen/teichoic acid export membrane protein